MLAEIISETSSESFNRFHIFGTLYIEPHLMFRDRYFSHALLAGSRSLSSIENGAEYISNAFERYSSGKFAGGIKPDPFI